MMRFAAGVMIAASFWSLLQPSIEYAENSYGSLAWLPAAIGFLTGGFFLRLIDAIVEPVGALLGAVAVLSMTAILPYALSFAAGAMIFVVVEELIPDSQTNGNTDVATLGLMVGFVIMMILDVALG
ncbi:ZIP family metal transporter [Streptococcus parasanguinis]